MDTKNTTTNPKNRFLKLSLKKNRLKLNEEPKKLNRSSDVILIDESFDRLKMNIHKNVRSTPIVYSPIVINDSCDSHDDSLPKVLISDKQPSKNGNVSFNSTKEDISVTKLNNTKPSIGGWSPAQNIIKATPRYETIPSTPKDVANESLEQCSIKKIQYSQKKLLDDLYGETWKSIPKLFKSIKQNLTNYDGVSKKLLFDDEDSDKENIRHELQKNKQLYLTGSEAKRKEIIYGTERKSKKKLYTEKIPSTPDVPKIKTKPRNANSTMKKVKAMSVTELVEIMRKDVDVLTNVGDTVDLAKQLKYNDINGADVLTNVGNASQDVKKNVLKNKIGNDITKDVDVLTKGVDKVSVDVKKKEIKKTVCVTPNNEIRKLSFMGSLADNVPSWRCHQDAFQYINNYKKTREELTRRLYVEFNKVVFDNVLEEDLPILWDGKLRSTAGTTTNRCLKNSKGERRRTSCIKLSTKVLDGPQRLRDTLIHELCHAATWLIDGELRAGHGPLWKKWATHALRRIPELGEISRCHDMEIHFKYSYKCTKCGYSIPRHSKSIDITKKCCGYCRGTFELIVNKKNKDGIVISTPARKGGPNDFAMYVKENYGKVKNGRSHADTMKFLGEQFSAKKRNAT